MIPNKNDPTQSKAPFPVGDHLLQRSQIVTGAPKGRMSDWQAIGRKNPCRNVPVFLPHTPAITGSRRTFRAIPKDIGGNQKVEEPLRLNREKISEPHKKPILDFFLSLDEFFQNASPLPKKPRVYPTPVTIRLRTGRIRSPRRSGTYSVSHHYAKAGSSPGQRSQ